MIRVMIVHDGSILSRGLGMLLSAEDDIDVVGEAVDARAALALAPALAPQVVLVDVDGCRSKGFSVARELALACPGTAVVMLSLHDDRETRASATQAGARSFVSKQAPAKVLEEIRSLRRLL